MPQLAGEDILASDINEAIPTYIVKAGSETVNNSATLQNDNDLVVALPVGVFRIEAVIHYTSSGTTADFSAAWTTTGTMTSLGRSILGPGQGMTVLTDMNVRFQGLAIGTGSDVGGNGTSSNVYMEDMLLEVTVAGTLQFQWAQRVATAVDTILTSASRMFITKVEAE